MAPPRSSSSAAAARKRMASARSPSASSRRAHAKAASSAVPPVPLSPPSPSQLAHTAPVELLSDDDGQLVLPMRFQCPLCFDVLRAPVALPCCRRHLCKECFERALELTSANCGFCRKRIVGLARTKQYKVDDALWSEIRRCCPFVAHADGGSDCLLDIEFVDENAPPRPRGDTEAAAPSAVRAPEVTTQADTHDHATSASTATAVATPRRATTASDPKTKMQRQLEAFFAGTLPSPDASLAHSRPSSAGSVRSLRSTTSSSSASSVKSNGRGRRRLDAVGKKSTIEATRVKPMLRSTSHSPKHRAPQAVQRTLLQLTLHSPASSSGARTTRQTTATTAAKAKGAKASTRPRRPWLCRHCTYENNCFDTRCIMCHQYPASTPALP